MRGLVWGIVVLPCSAAAPILEPDKQPTCVTRRRSRVQSEGWNRVGDVTVRTMDTRQYTDC
jgi:hypothetical protein